MTELTLPPPRPCADALTLLKTRRSAPAKAMTGPGPNPRQVDELLAVAARVPDHRMMVPFRFVVFEGEGRAAFADELARIAEADGELGAKDGEKLRALYEAAPLAVAVVSRVDEDHKTPEWEQLLTAGAACQNLLIGAAAMGFGAQWLTGWPAYHEGVRKVLGMGKSERVAGFVFVGTPGSELTDRQRPEMGSIVERFAAER